MNYRDHSSGCSWGCEPNLGFIGLGCDAGTQLPSEAHTAVNMGAWGVNRTAVTKHKVEWQIIIVTYCF